MKKYNTLIRTMAILLMAGAALVSCSKDKEPVSGKFSMTVEATMGYNETKGLIPNGNNIVATWETTDVVTVYNNNNEELGTLDVTNISADGASCTLTGTVSGTISNQLTLALRSSNYNTQGGTLEYIAQNCDYATANIEASVSGGHITPSSAAVFENHQAIVKFTLKTLDGLVTLNASQLVVKANGNNIIVTPSSPTSELYVAIPGLSDKTITLIAYVDGDTYTRKQENVTFANSQFYNISVGLVYDELYAPLTFEATENGTTVTFNINTSSEAVSSTGKVQFSNDCITWTTYTYGSSISINAGQKLMFRGNWGKYNGSTFSCNKDCYVYGNVMSLQNATTYPELTSLGNRAFTSLFNKNEHIVNHSTKNLLLPATTLGNSNCYNSMFKECTGLTRVPELPATSLGDFCYQNMFSGCTGLTTIPTNLLKATVLKPGCYNAMFYKCTNLTNVPNLPATVLEERCYLSMFNGCSSLTTVPENLLHATNLAESCYETMFRNSGLTVAPILPAANLSNKCYKYMFDGCSNLNSVTCLATNIAFNTENEESSPTYHWLNNVASTGTFITPSTTDWTVNTPISGIPSGWARMDAE